MSIEVMKQALAALVWEAEGWEDVPPITRDAITALRAAIEHAERPQTHSDDCWRWHHQCAVAKIERMQVQKPVAWMYEHDGMVHNADNPPTFAVNRWNTPVGEPYTETPLYTAPRQWQGLTDDEIWACNVAPAGHHVESHICVAHQNVLDFAEAIEAKLKEKNT